MSDVHLNLKDMSLPVVRAAGGIVYRLVGNDIEVILVGSGQPTQWRLPKGIVDSGEAIAQAALREVREESGAIAEIETEIDVAYWTYEYEGARHRKETTYFLMKYIGGDINQHDHEYEQVIWVPARCFSDRLYFESERCVAKKGALFLGFKGESTDV